MRADPVSVDGVVMYQHLGIDSLTVQPAPQAGPNDMSERMVFHVRYTTARGADPCTMDICLKDMVNSESNIHLNALTHFMQRLLVSTPDQGDFEETFKGVDPGPPMGTAQVRQRQKQLARHAACLHCSHCEKAALSAVAKPGEGH